MSTLRLSKTKASFVNPFHRYSDLRRFSSPFVPDLDSENYCDGSLDVVKSSFNEGLEDRGEALKQSLEDEDQLNTMDD
jgi:hypothetical protein